MLACVELAALATALLGCILKLRIVSSLRLIDPGRGTEVRYMGSRKQDNEEQMKQKHFIKEKAFALLHDCVNVPSCECTLSDLNILVGSAKHFFLATSSFLLIGNSLSRWPLSLQPICSKLCSKCYSNLA